MKELRDPPRLKLGADDALKDALSALESGGPSAQSMARMSQQLSPLFQASPQAPALATSLKLGGLLVLGAATWIAWSAWRAAPSTTHATSNAATAVPATRTSAAPKAPTVTAPAPSAPSARPPAVPPTAEAPEQTAMAGPRTAKHDRERRPAVASAEGGSRSETRDAARAPVATSSETSAPANAPEPSDQVRLSPPALDEPTLLRKARALAKSDPSAAWKLVAEHERRFPYGMLVQEREQLAIELLQALSREGEARARLQAFRQRFPDSIYLRRGRAER